MEGRRRTVLHQSNEVQRFLSEGAKEWQRFKRRTAPADGTQRTTRLACDRFSVVVGTTANDPLGSAFALAAIAVGLAVNLRLVEGEAAVALPGTPEELRRLWDTLLVFITLVVERVRDAERYSTTVASKLR